MNIIYLCTNIKYIHTFQLGIYLYIIKSQEKETKISGCLYKNKYLDI